MAEKILSPGVFTNEIDQSFLPATSGPIGAAIVGPTVKGPVLVPTVVSSYSEYVNIFGVPFTCEEALNWGLMGAAQALGMQDVIGSLSPGKQADIVLIDGNSLTMSGWDRSNVASAILLHAQARDVDSVWIAGKAAKRNGKLVANTERPSSLLKAATDRVRSKVEAVGGFLISPEELTMRLNAVAESESGDYKFEEIS